MFFPGPAVQPGGPARKGAGFFSVLALLGILPGVPFLSFHPGPGPSAEKTPLFAPLLVWGGKGVDVVLVRKAKAPAVLQVREGRGPLREVPAGEGTWLRVALPPLAGRGPFSYRFTWKGGGTGWHSFRPLPPAGGKELHFAAYGDSRSNPKVHRALVALMEARGPDLVVNTGDLVGRGTLWDQWERSFLRPLAPLASRVPLFTVMGNHEGESPSYFKLCAKGGKKRAWWSADVGPVHFVGLDSNVSLKPGSPQRKWLEKDLERAAPSRAWKILLLHHPLFTACPGRKPVARVRALLPLLAAKGVSLVLEGHDHHYMRTYPVVMRQGEASAPGLVCVTTGGGGAPLYPLRPAPFAAKALRTWHFLWFDVGREKLSVKVFDWKGKEIDTWVMTREKGMAGPRYWVGSEKVVQAGRKALDRVGPLLLGPGVPRSLSFSMIPPAGLPGLPRMGLLLRGGKEGAGAWSLSGGGEALPGRPWRWVIHLPPPGRITASSHWPRLFLEFQEKGLAGRIRSLGPIPLWKPRGPWRLGGQGLRPLPLVDRWGNRVPPGELEAFLDGKKLLVRFQSSLGEKKTSRPKKAAYAGWARRSLAERLVLHLCGSKGEGMQSFQVTRSYRRFHTGWEKKGTSPRRGWRVWVLPGLKGKGWGARWEISLEERGLPGPGKGLLFQVSHFLPFQDVYASSGPLKSDFSPWPGAMKAFSLLKAQ